MLSWWIWIYLSENTFLKAPNLQEGLVAQTRHKYNQNGKVTLLLRERHTLQGRQPVEAFPVLLLLVLCQTLIALRFRPLC